MDSNQLKIRTKNFALKIIELFRKLPDTREAKLIGGQLFRAGTSVAANYRSACRGRSKADFIAKMGIVLEEADESMFWLELLIESKIICGNEVKDLLNESNELISIFVSSIKTAKRSGR